MKKFYFVGYTSPRVESQHLADIKNDPDVELITENLNIKLRRNKVLKKIFFLCHSWKIIKDGEPVFKNFWNRFYSILEYPFEEQNEHYIIFFDSAISQYYSEAFFLKLKERPNVKIVLYVYDQMTQYYSDRILRMSRYADVVICTIHEDCKQYGFTYFPLVYPCINNPNQKDTTILNDIYFLGTNGGRLRYLTEIYEYLTSNNVKCDFNIVGVPENEQKYVGEITYNKPLSTPENIQHVASCNCVLEVMHEGMNAVTSRYAEVLSMNKKLLTNNINVKYEKYYNPEFMRLFESVKEIDIDWLTRCENIDYGYKNEFSARALINFIIDLL